MGKPDLQWLHESGTKDNDCSDIIHKVLASVGFDQFRLHGCHRLGSYIPNKMQPTIAHFVFFQDKLSVLKKWSELRNKCIIIHDDLPPEVIAKRAQLIPVLRHWKNSGEKTTLVHDKLKYKGTLYSMDNIYTIPFDLSGTGTKITDTHVFFSG